MLILMKSLSSEELKYRIRILRQRMINVGLEDGLDHQHTVEISQKLDLYLTELQNRNHQIQISTA